MTPFEFHYAAVAGTFDRLHAGHKAVLQKAFESAETVLLGITDQAMTEQKALAKLIQPYAERKKAIEQFLAENDLADRCTILPLHDIYGPAATDTTLQAIIVSKNTLEGAELVNAQRQANGLPALAIVVADYVAANDTSYLSSTRIRAGEIDRNGMSYAQFLSHIVPLTISFPQRSLLQQPLGPVLAGKENDLDNAVNKAKVFCKTAELVYAVGDVVTESFQKNAVHVDLAVFDYRNKRKDTKDTALHNPDKRNWFMVTNDAGTISKSAIDGLIEIHKVLLSQIDKKETHYLLVGGEEDLLVLPIILLAPLNSVIFYGQSGQGIVMVRVTEAEKQKTLAFLQNAG